MSRSTTYTLGDVTVRGGTLAVGSWGAIDSAETIIGLHGVTGSHRDWTYLGESLDEGMRLLAPDLRGRAGSSRISGPWGMAAHVDDVIALLDAEQLEAGVLLGHSMGGFVAVLAAVRHPDRVRGVVLVDGGLPAVEANAGGDELTRIVLAAARERLQATFPTVADYIAALTAALPAGHAFTPTMERIAQYDLVPADGGYRIAGTYDAIAADAAHIAGDGSAVALRALNRPAILLRAAQGLPPREEGLYSQREVDAWTAEVASLESRNVDGVDHGSIMREPEALRLVRAAVQDVLRSTA